MTIRAAIFDLGGTLLHYHDPLQDDLRRGFRRITLEGIRLLVEQVAVDGAASGAAGELASLIDRHIGEAYLASLQDLRGGSIETPIRAGLAEGGIPLTDEQWAALRGVFYSAIDQIVTARTGLHETLHALHEQGCQLGIISNTYWAADLHDRHLAEHGLLEYFPLRIYSCDQPYMKPHPAIFNQALDALGLAPEQAVYVGDRPDVDIAGAQHVGMYGVLIESPYRLEEPGDVVPDATIRELPDLLTVLPALGMASA